MKCIMCGEPATYYINWVFTESSEDDRQFPLCDKHHTNLKAYKEMQEEKEDEK